MDHFTVTQTDATRAEVRTPAGALIGVASESPQRPPRMLAGLRRSVAALIGAAGQPHGPTWRANCRDGLPSEKFPTQAEAVARIQDAGTQPANIAVNGRPSAPVRVYVREPIPFTEITEPQPDEIITVDICSQQSVAAQPGDAVAVTVHDPATRRPALIIAGNARAVSAQQITLADFTLRHPPRPPQ